MKVLFVVTHLLGTGHLSRALTLARAFTAAGHHASVLSGGLPAPHLDSAGVTLVQMPPVRSDGVNFSALLDEHGAPASPNHLSARVQLARKTLQDMQPDVLITELFPFGRKSMLAEFTDILDAAHAQARKPLVLASIRDILAPPRKAKKVALADDMITRFYDGVLIHSDAAITPLDVSWPITPALDGKLHYTGFVAPPKPALEGATLPKGEIIVSAGGGDVGLHLYETAIETARVSEHNWRILIGGTSAPEHCARLSANAPANVIIEPARPDFRQLLYHAACSVSLCGYNTALDILQANCAAVFVPFDEGNEVEQTIRATSLAKRAEIGVLKRSDLLAEALLARTNDVIAAPKNAVSSMDMDGANQTVHIVNNLLESNVHVR